METRAIKPHLTIICILAIASLALGFTVDPRITDVAGVTVALPNQVGEWRGEEIRFCQNSSCQGAFMTSELGGRDVCPKCGSKLDAMSLIEKALLPADTILLKKKYKNAAGRQIFASVVMSGRERASIHRPEVCLVGQNNEITKRFVMPVPIEGRDKLDVMTLNLLYHQRDSQGQTSEAGTYYAYWFVGNGRETPYHWQRMTWMATDRIFHNIAHRWAYIAVSGVRDTGSDEYEKEAAGFIHDLYPQMAIKPTPTS